MVSETFLSLLNFLLITTPTEKTNVRAKRFQVYYLISKLSSHKYCRAQILAIDHSNVALNNRYRFKSLFWSHFYSLITGVRQWGPDYKRGKWLWLSRFGKFIFPISNLITKLCSSLLKLLIMRTDFTEFTWNIRGLPRCKNLWTFSLFWSYF